MLLNSCGEDTTQEAKDEFSKYFNGKDEVVLNIEDNIYFENYILKKEDFEPSHLYGTIIFYEKSIYYLSLANLNCINIYSCDYFGDNMQMVYSKELKKFSKAKIKTHNDSFYIEYKKDKLIYIDKYTISIGRYENLTSGKDCSLADYFPSEEQSRYSVEVIENISPKKHGKFIVTDLETGLSNIIDDDYLKNTIYFESMEMFNYGPKRFDISNGHILLTYGIGAGDGWNYPHLVYEYDFNLNTIEYKLLAFPYDSVPIDIIYIGE